MFISDKYRLVFLEVPRTASNSISKALSVIDPDSVTVKKRQTKPMHNYHDFNIPDHANEYRIVATHRNPYERLWSHWKHRRNIGNPEVFKTTSWEDYVAWVLDPKSIESAKNAMRELPITKLKNMNRVTHWLSFSQLASDWDKLCKELELPKSPLTRQNLSPDFGPMFSSYNNEIAESVYCFFKTDFDRFQYLKESWQTPKTENIDPPKQGSNVDSSLPELSTNAIAKVAILTAFVKSDPAYSLNRVVQDQISMLVQYGYKPIVFVSESTFWKKPLDNFALADVELIQLPNLNNKHNKDLSKEDKILLIQDALQPELDGVDVVITHDLIYQPTYIDISEAALLCAHELPKIKWLHWVHSATKLLDLFDAQGCTIGPSQKLANWPNAHPICFNHLEVIRTANNFECPENIVRVIPHPIDVVSFLDLSEYAAQIYHSMRLYSADYICTLPVRLDRGKQVEWPIKIMASLKSSGFSVRLLIMDFHSQGDLKHEYRDDLKKVADEWGLADSDLVFLSEFDQQSKHNSPQSLVRELFQLSNIYIHASRSESYSLVSQEAAISSNLLILNEDFTPMREIYGDNALYFKFSSNIDRTTNLDGITNTGYLDVSSYTKPVGFDEQHIYKKGGLWFIKGETVFANQIAAKIVSEFANNKTLGQRQIRMRYRNIHSVFKQKLEPCLY